MSEKMPEITKEFMESEQKEILNINVSAWNLQCAIGFILQRLPSIENENDRDGMREIVTGLAKELKRARAELKEKYNSV